MNYFLELGVILLVYMTIWHFISLILKRSDLADIAWGLGFVMIAWAAYFISGSGSTYALLANVLVTIWGIRLATHIYLRNKDKEEDYRYKKWREDWDKLFPIRSYFQIFILQGILLYVISLPVLLINRASTGEFQILSFLAILGWIIGFLFEVIADYQLKKFIEKKDKKSKLLTTGLWKYSRHPNYFGEVLVWWSIWLYSLPVYFSLYSVVAPLTITVLILKISGIPLLEEKMKDREGFEDYKRKTNKFFPFFPKK